MAPVLVQEKQTMEMENKMKNKMKKKKLKIEKLAYDVEQVQWDDSASYGSWHIIKERGYAPVVCTSVGCVVYEDKHCVAITATYAALKPKRDTTDVMVIPKSAIIGRRMLAEAGK